MIVSDARAFQSTLKMQIFAIGHQISIYGLDIYFSICRMSYNNQIYIYIHRMQIWRTTQSAPRTSLMKARLVRPGCFVLTMPPQKNLASSSISFVLFRYDLLYFWTPREIRWPIFGNTTNNSWNTTQYFWNTNQFCETQHKIVETQHKIIETQHKISIETQHKIVETQHKIAETQHKITETQHKIIETQHKVVETTQNYRTQYKIIETQHKVVETQHKITETQHKIIETTQNIGGTLG